MPDVTTIDTDIVSTITIQNPADGSTVGEVDCDTPSAVEAAVAEAAAAQADWEALGAEERARLLCLIADALAEAADELAELNRQETGKTLEDSHGGIEAAIGTVRQYAELGPVHRGHSLRGDRLAADYTRHRAHGVAAIITPWNDPVAIAMGLISAALISGNTVVHKPSERCPHLGLRLGQICEEVLPDGVMSTVSGGQSVGRVLVGNEEVSLCAHVGSSSAGLDIHLRGAAHGAHVIRENGGNDPLIVDSGVDPQWAAQQAALGSFANAGQICTSVERIFVHRDISEDFVSALVAEAERVNGEHAPQPLVDRNHRRTVHSLVSESVNAGAQALTGGQVPDGPGAHYPATVLLGCRPGMPVIDQEVFGPVAPVCIAEDFEEALGLARSGSFGLAATVLTSDMGHTLDAVDRLRVGTVKINEVFGGAPGGSAEPRGESGSGFGFGPELLDEMSTTSVVHIAPAGGQRR
ncbi:aldehyde dehydrogenase family protein [Brevibacterium renqingii]|uniref:aldehyde dehydrogenase family protein n=1 Tax=Brevibacterium renqingii TaxID=2776916 RepID=UPI001ADF9955|nr:aldehyde dehydrogenase family protein [Brevibacterium renqingii]